MRDQTLCRMLGSIFAAEQQQQARCRQAVRAVLGPKCQHQVAASEEGKAEPPGALAALAGCDADDCEAEHSAHQHKHRASDRGAVRGSQARYNQCRHRDRNHQSGDRKASPAHEDCLPGATDIYLIGHFLRHLDRLTKAFVRLLLYPRNLRSAAVEVSVSTTAGDWKSVVAASSTASRISPDRLAAPIVSLISWSTPVRSRGLSR